MLKVRLMGTKNDIAWFKKIMQRHPKIEVLEMSDLYPNKGTDKYYQDCYLSGHISWIDSSYLYQWSIVPGRLAVLSVL